MKSKCRNPVYLCLIILFSVQIVAISNLAASNGSICSQYLQKIEQKNSATYLDSEGILHISEEAYVHGGKPVNTKKFKAPELILKKGRPGATGAYIIIDNFLHDGIYVKAKIHLSKKSVKNVYVQTMPFEIVPGVMAGHVQARFEMNDGYEIELLEHKFIGTVKDLIVSYEAALPVGGSYNFALGAIDSSPIVGRIVSGQQKYQEGPDRAFNQYLLPLDSLEASELLDFYLMDSIKIKMKDYYNTIVRNCTTTIFDGIDSLKRFKNLIENGKLLPFLTTIGGDPVVGPAINALLERFGDKLLQVQDMKEEYKNIFYNLGVPRKVDSFAVPFAPGSKDPMALLILTSGTDRLSEKDKKIIESVVDDIVHDLPETLNMLLLSSVSVTEDLQTTPMLLQGLFQVITKKLQSRVHALKGKLPETPVDIQIQFSPYPTKSDGTDLRKQGLRAKLPFPIVKIDLDQEEKNSVYSLILDQLLEMDSLVENTLPAYLKSLSVQLRLINMNSMATTQILLGLNAISKEIHISNNQVDLKEFQIPKPTSFKPSFFQELNQKMNPWAKAINSEPRVNLLLTHAQSLENHPINPLASLKFGAEFELNPQGMIQILDLTKSKYLCWTGKSPHGPELKGTLSHNALGDKNWVTRFLSKFLSGRPVTLSMTDLEMNLQDLSLKTVRLKVGVLNLKCLELESVNKQFGDQANQKLQDLIKRVGPANLVIP